MWLPPRSLADRSDWSRAHPWIAGCYFGILLAVVMCVLSVLSGAPWAIALIVAIVVWFVAGSLFAALLQRRMGERPDAERYPAPTYRRLWSHVSDRYLFWLMILGIGGTAASVITLAWSRRSVSDVIALICGFWLAGSTWSERRVRDRAP